MHTMQVTVRLGAIIPSRKALLHRDGMDKVKAY
jgi:hypothetical protein